MKNETIHTYNYVIIDDDDFARETLEDLLLEIPGLKMLKSISESGMAIKHLATLQPDIVFLDINMPDKSGLDVQKEILELNLQSKVIFTTAHEEYVLEAFKSQAFDYLVKPVSKAELEETLQRLFEQNSKANDKAEETTKASLDEIIIKNAFGTLLLKSEEVIYVEADGAYSTIYLTNNRREVVSRNLGKIENLFPEESFFKTSRSNIINLKYLVRTDRLNKKVELSCGIEKFQIKVSRERFYDLERRLSGRVNLDNSSGI